MNCLVCGTKLPALYKLYFKPSTGIECQNCHSVLNHKKRSLFLTYLALLVFIGFLVAGMGQGDFWWAAVAINLTVLVLLQYLAPLRVIYENKHHK